ncbi:hypothetical protein [Sulfuricurvum sp.]|uniref:Hpt domain-containing protein n=1 Tax=Sulfuricurvum sp. TaxID=2025608 RepID=UPI003563AF71
MLFYNHKQEFIGIDEEGLRLLNYASMEELLSVCGDVADLFAKEPGYIHNFKNFGWIDFLLHADSDASSAIVHGNGRTFTCTLSVQKLFLSENLSENGYIIDMTHVKSLSGEEVKPHIITPSPYTAKTSPVPESFPEVPSPEVSIPSSLPDYGHITPTVLSEPDTLDVPLFEEKELISEDDLYANLSLPLSHEELLQEEGHLPIVPKPAERPMLGDSHYSHSEQAFINNLKTDKSYQFDPKVAASELGLPVDLIEEFIGDFIQQANEFKEELFEAVLKGDMNNLKILSHKLKGVAANLRIEDAFETLSIINTSDDSAEIEANLKYFYAIIRKLEGKEPDSFPETESLEREETVTPSVTQSTDTYPKQTLQDDDIYEFSLKQHDNEPVLVHEEDLYPLPIIPEEPPVEPSDEILENVSEKNDTKIDLSPVPEETLSEEVEVTLHYDGSSIAGSLGISPQFMKELLNDYKSEAQNASERISGAIGAFDTHSWKRIASELKGISDNLRLAEISEELAILSQTNDAQEANKASKRLVGYIAQL